MSVNLDATPNFAPAKDDDNSSVEEVAKFEKVVEQPKKTAKATILIDNLRSQLLSPTQQQNKVQ